MPTSKAHMRLITIQPAASETPTINVNKKRQQQQPQQQQQK